MGLVDSKSAKSVIATNETTIVIKNKETASRFKSEININDEQASFTLFLSTDSNSILAKQVKRLYDSNKYAAFRTLNRWPIIEVIFKFRGPKSNSSDKDRWPLEKDQIYLDSYYNYTRAFLELTASDSEEEFLKGMPYIALCNLLSKLLSLGKASNETIVSLGAISDDPKSQLGLIKMYIQLGFTVYRPDQLKQDLRNDESVVMTATVNKIRKVCNRRLVNS